MDLLRPHLRNGNLLTTGSVEAASRKGTALYDALETVLKGVEVKLPSGCHFTDKEGHVRHDIRTRWWNADLTSYRAAYIGPAGVEIPDIEMDGHERLPEPDRPTFIGHYWFDSTQAITPAAKRVACVDYSVAMGGPLVAYRFDGEQELSKDKFVAV